MADYSRADLRVLAEEGARLHKSEYEPEGIVSRALLAEMDRSAALEAALAEAEELNERFGAIAARCNNEREAAVERAERAEAEIKENEKIITAAEAALKRAESDAGRYVWLRDVWKKLRDGDPHVCVLWSPDWDAAIDAARRGAAEREDAIARLAGADRSSAGG